MKTIRRGTRAIIPMVGLAFMLSFDGASAEKDTDPHFRIVNEKNQPMQQSLPDMYKWLAPLEEMNCHNLLPCYADTAYGSYRVGLPREGPSGKLQNTIPDIWLQPRSFYYPGLGTTIEALDRDFPRTESRLRFLFKWYGSGAGPWSGYPAYELCTEQLLLIQPWGDLCQIIDKDSLTPAETEGAARFIATANDPILTALLSTTAKTKLKGYVESLKDPDKMKMLTEALETRSDVPKEQQKTDLDLSNYATGWNVRNEKGAVISLDYSKLSHWFNLAPKHLRQPSILISPNPETKCLSDSVRRRELSPILLVETSVDPLNEALNKDLPFANSRIHHLLEWYGSSDGSWTNYPMYESIPEELLFLQPWGTIADVLDEASLSSTELNGAARLIATLSVQYSYYSSPIISLLSETAKKRLLDHVASMHDDEKLKLLKAALAGQSPTAN